MKRSISAAVTVFLLASLALASGLAARCSRRGAGLSVKLTVTESSGVARSREPVTSGVPLARSQGIVSTDGLRLLDSSGAVVPAQFTVTSRWGGGPGDSGLPIRWLLIDFLATVDAGGRATYRLVEGVSEAPKKTGLEVTRNDSDYLEVSTGAGNFRFNKRGFSLFDRVTVGSARLVRPSGGSDIVAETPSGAVYRSSAAPVRMVLETDGPVRKTIRVRGKLKGHSGGLLDYTCRVSLYAGSTEARVKLSVSNLKGPSLREGQPLFYDIGCPDSAVFEDLTVRVRTEPVDDGKVLLGGVGTCQEPSGTMVVYQDSSGTGRWDFHRGRHPRPQSYVSFRGYLVERDGSLVSRGNKAQPWMDCRGPAGGVAVAVRDFWENYPKALRGNGGRLEASIFPREYSAPFSFRPGEQKTHEMTFFFHGPGDVSGAVRKKAAGLEAPLFAEASSAYYISSGAFGRVSGPTDDTRFSAYGELNRSTLYGADANIFKAFKGVEFYSWQDYGEVPVDYEDGGTAAFNDKYDLHLGMLLQYARTRDRRWLDLAGAAGRHVADLDVFHYGGRLDTWWEGGFFGNGNHDEDGNANPNRNYISPHTDLAFGAPGLFTLYYLTGYRPGYDAAVEVADNIRYRYENSYGRGNGGGFAECPDYENDCENGRSFAFAIRILSEAYRATGDVSYLKTAEWVIKNSRKASDPFLTEPVPGDRRFVKLFQWDLLEAALGRYLDLLGEIGRDDRAKAREQLLDMTRHEAEHMWRTDARGNSGVPYAWMRDGTPWGWEDREVAVNVCNWQLLTADALAYGYIHGGSRDLLDKAGEAFRTGSDPDIEYYEPAYTAMKEVTNSANYGLVYMSVIHTPGEVSVDEERFHEWLCLQNPGGVQACVDITYFLADGRTERREVAAPVRTRMTMNVNRSEEGGAYP